MRYLTKFLSVRCWINFVSKQVLWLRLIFYKKLDSIWIFVGISLLLTHVRHSRLCILPDIKAVLCLVQSVLYLIHSHSSIVSVGAHTVLKTFDSIITFIILWFPFMFLYISLLPFIFLCYLSYFFVSLSYFFVNLHVSLSPFYIYLCICHISLIP